MAFLVLPVYKQNQDMFDNILEGTGGVKYKED